MYSECDPLLGFYKTYDNHIHQLSYTASKWCWLKSEVEHAAPSTTQGISGTKFEYPGSSSEAVQVVLWRRTYTFSWITMKSMFVLRLRRDSSKNVCFVRVLTISKNSKTKYLHFQMMARSLLEVHSLFTSTPTASERLPGRWWNDVGCRRCGMLNPRPPDRIIRQLRRTVNAHVVP
jgi:hypothetical protein